ncbi:MAG: hypothetical protein Q8M24_13345 [Pseudolabrys sp.]|nr:hypothetical protein [Pseudolabrys sp.]MDP2296428.1 hypothetical protein [Pseudolabrys sp.]
MSLDIKDRKLSSVSITQISPIIDPDGTHNVSCMCHISLSGPDEEREGPGANIFFSIPLSQSTSFQDASDALLKRAHEILARMSEFPFSELRSGYEEWRAREWQALESAKRSGFAAPDHA